jgi:hypothetical protein
MGRIASPGLQMPLLKSGLFGMHTSTDAFSTRSCLQACAHFQKVEQQLCSLKVGVIAVAVRDGRDHVALRHQLHDVGPILHDVEAGQCPQWKDITHQSHLQYLLGLVNPLSIKRKPATAPLGVSQWRVWDSPYSFSLQQGEGSTESASRRIFRRISWCQQNPGQGKIVVLLATSEE